jgi:tape measure domain-containing protein
MATISNNDIKIRYVVETANLEAAAQAFDKLSAEEKQALAELKRFNKESQDTGKSMSQLSSIATKAGTAIAGVFAFSQIKAFGQAVFETTLKFQQFQKVLDFTSGSAIAGSRSMQFLVETSNRLGISLDASVAGFKTLSGAATQAGLSNSQTQKVFENVSQAVKAFGLSSEDARGVFLALGQIISKGTVQAEELRGQIGERIPGAFSIAAKSIGVTEQQLNKMMATGKLTSKDFIIPFTAELAKASSAAGGSNGLAQNVNRIENAFTILQTRIGRFFMPLMTQTSALLEKALNYANQLLKTQDDVQAEKNQKAYNETLKQTALLSNNALRAQIQQEEVKLALIEKQFKNTTDKATADALREQFLIQQSIVDAYNEEIKTRNQSTAEIIVDEKERAKLLKQEYDDRLRILELLKQQRILTGELFDDPLAKIGAEKAFQEAKLKLQKEYMAKGGDITIQEIKVTNLERLNAEQDFYQQSEALRMENYREVVQTEEDIRKERLKTMQKGIKDNKEANDKIAANNAEMLRIYKREQEEKVAIMEKSFEIGQIITDAGFNIYQGRLSNELTLLQRRYDEEIRLADGNEQKIAEIEQKRAEKEREIKLKQFKADQAAAVARVIFETASMIAKWSTNPVTAPLAALSILAQAAQIGAILSQPVPEFAEGTKGVPFKGGKAIVGERGVEKVVTESGKVYFTPPTATLVDLPKGSQVIPNHALSRQELFLASHYSKGGSSASPVVGKLDELGSILKGLPITQVSMDEKGFEKFIRTPRRTTKILNNRFRSDSF